MCAGDIFSSEGETRFKPPPFLRALALKTSKCFLRSEKRKHLQLTHSYQSQQNTFYIEVLFQHWDNKLASWEAHKQTHWQATRLTDEKRTRGQDDKMTRWYDMISVNIFSFLSRDRKTGICLFSVKRQRVWNTFHPQRKNPKTCFLQHPLSIIMF